jgi:phosphate-selective porin
MFLPIFPGADRMHFHTRTPRSLHEVVSRAVLGLFAASRPVMTREMLVMAVAMAFVLSAAPAGAQVQQDAQSPAQTPPQTQDAPRFSFSFDNNPSLRIGTNVRLEGHFKSQVDWRDFSDDGSRDALDLNRARVGLDGRVSRYVEYQVEREVRGTKRPWRDVYVNVRPLRAFQVQLGRFKMPFGLEQTTSSMDLNFAYRALASTYLAPSRDVGVMAHGSLLRNALKYELGVFREGGDNARITEEYVRVNRRTVAGRIVTRPLRALPYASLRELDIGAAFTAGLVPEGLNSLRFETVSGERLADRIYVNGLRRRIGAELRWRPGPLSFDGEVIRVSDERRGQGIYDDNLPDAVQQGWYLSGTWLITGEEKKDDVDPAAPFLQGGLGAFEIAGRLEALTFGGGPRDEAASPGPRARRIPEKRDMAWTVGLNWYVNRFVRVRANVVRELREQAATIPLLTRAWSRTLRVQFQF